MVRSDSNRADRRSDVDIAFLTIPASANSAHNFGHLGYFRKSAVQDRLIGTWIDIDLRRLIACPLESSQDDPIYPARPAGSRCQLLDLWGPRDLFHFLPYFYEIDQHVPEMQI
jgi:hypothetical protein